MSDHPGPDRDSGLLTPSSRAVAGLGLAVAGLFGQDALTTGLQLIFMSGPEAGDQGVFGVLLGLSTALPAGLALLLALPVARDGGSGWPTQLARAAVVLAVVALVGAALMVVGGLLQF